MSTWVLLTNTDGNPIAVNMNDVSHIVGNKNGPQSLLYFSHTRGDSLVYVEVRELPDQILAKLA